MATDDKAAVATVDSSAAEQQSGTEVLKKLTPTQMKTWRTTGNLPEEKPAEVKAEKKSETKDSKTDGDSSTPAKTEVSEKAPEKAASETAAASVPAKTEPKANAETRIKGLLAENKELKAKIDELQKQPIAVVKKEEAPPKPQRADVDAKTGKPLYATDEEYLDARDKYVADMASRQTRQQIAKDENDRRVAEQNRLIEKRLENSLKICMEKHADFDSVVQRKEEEKDGKKVTTFNAPALKLIKIGGMIDAWIIDSEIGSEIMYYLATRPEEVERIQALNAFAASRELTKLEDKLLAVEAPASKKDGTPPESSTAPPKVTGAPAPASSVGGKATAPGDEEEAATQAGDFKRFQKAANEADWRKKKAS